MNLRRFLGAADVQGEIDHPDGKTFATILAISSCSCVNMSLIWHLGFFFLLVGICSGSGYFQVQIESILNPKGELSNGSCCGGPKDTTGTCVSSCQTKIRVCLREYQIRTRLDLNTCAFGSITSQVLGGNFVKYPNDTGPILTLPFVMAWRVSDVLYNISISCYNFFTSKKRVVFKMNVVTLCQVLV